MPRVIPIGTVKSIYIFLYLSAIIHSRFNEGNLQLENTYVFYVQCSSTRPAFIVHQENARIDTHLYPHEYRDGNRPCPFQNANACSILFLATHPALRGQIKWYSAESIKLIGGGLQIHQSPIFMPLMIPHVLREVPLPFSPLSTQLVFQLSPRLTSPGLQPSNKYDGRTKGDFLRDAQPQQPGRSPSYKYTSATAPMLDQYTRKP